MNCNATKAKFTLCLYTQHIDILVKATTDISEIKDIADWEDAVSVCFDRGFVLESNLTVLSKYLQQNNNVQSIWSGSYIAMLPWMEILVLNDIDIQIDIPSDTINSCVYSDCISTEQRYEKDDCRKPYIALCRSSETTDGSDTLTSAVTSLQNGLTDETKGSTTITFTVTEGFQNGMLLLATQSDL
ncbi:unnamed protein product [Mytilus coruscus]|uniref:Uncharacterized protein n=1 Tax=Mytilus coruscus TaxID=42192 RepID=A0A6J8ATL7_MYTCO|nr:unnamed protein product [Mytilus coruscus]